MSSSGQDTDIKSLVTRIEMVESVNRALEDEQRSIRRDAMHLENIVVSIWRATMGPIPLTPDPVPTPPDPMPPAPRPRPPVPRPPVAPAPDPIPTPPAPPKTPAEAKNRVFEAFNSLRGRFGW